MKLTTPANSIYNYVTTTALSFKIIRLNIFPARRPAMPGKATIKNDCCHVLVQFVTLTDVHEAGCRTAAGPIPEALIDERDPENRA